MIKRRKKKEIFLRKEDEEEIKKNVAKEREGNFSFQIINFTAIIRQIVFSHDSSFSLSLLQISKRGGLWNISEQKD